MTDLRPTDLRTLMKATGGALLVALVVLTLFILPAEYGVDPTGAGGALGLTALGADPPVDDRPEPATVQSKVLSDFPVRWPVTTRLVAEDDGTTDVGASVTVRVPVAQPNVTSLTAVLSWTDDDVAGQQTEPDTFEVLIMAPDGTNRSWLGRNDGPAGSVTAEMVVGAAPQGNSVEAATEAEARALLTASYPGVTAGTGEWVVEVTLQDAGGLGPVPDEGNDWNLRVLATSYAMAIDEGVPTGERQDTISVVVPARTGVEYKVFAMEGAAFDYSWSAPAPLFYDFHGVRGDGSETSHESATAAEREGRFVAPYHGKHGWYWQNDSLQDVTLTLELSGSYRVL